jgi:hypothetical protein
MSEKRKERQREVDYRHFNGFYVLTKCQLMEEISYMSKM